MRRTRTVSKAVPHRRQATSTVHSHTMTGGFTLVEMLVAVTLVLLMMSMFAEIFQIAGGSIAKTRGLAENDQRSRTLQTIIKADLDKRSFRWVYPFAKEEDPAAPESNINDRKGYFSISENNPYNALDDVLQFTVVSTVTSHNKDESPYYGQALNLTANSTTNANQPDYDDLQWFNNTAYSIEAEVVYFVRNGNLYRRQLMIRDQKSGSDPEPDDSPANNPARHVFDPTATLAPAFQYPPPGTNSTFWADFDFAAYYDENGSGQSTGAHFLGRNSLNNSGLSLVAIAAPFRRYGHYHNDVTGGNAGRPKEFCRDSADAEFIGRFTLQECSDPDFKYPHSKIAGSKVPTDPSLTLTLDLNDKTVTGPLDFTQGTRRGEDLLLSNVHAFDILVWDDNYGGFVNIGDPSLPTTSDYYIDPDPTKTDQRRNDKYGPRVNEFRGSPDRYATNAVFDTWHPKLDIGGDSVNDDPPFRPITYRPDYQSGSETTKSPWKKETVYNIGDVVFPKEVTAKAYPGTPYYYRCVQRDRGPKNKGNGNGLQGVNRSDDTTEPSWPRAAGLVVEDNALSWQAVDNRKPLKAVKLEVRFIDPSTQQLRQLTIIHSLVD